MLLSEIRTVDALILQLAARGYRNAEIDEVPLGDAGYRFYQGEIDPISGDQAHAALLGWPSGVEDTGDVGFGVRVRPDGTLHHWYCFEQYAGCTGDLDPETTLDQLESAIDSWYLRIRQEAR